MKAMGFPSGVPGVPESIFAPENFVNPVLVYDWGPTFDPRDGTGVPSNLPPPIKRVIAMKVPKVDRDGNELGGVPTVLRDAPLGTEADLDSPAMVLLGGEFPLELHRVKSDYGATREIRNAPWKICPAHTSFGCASRSQGVAPAYGETVPQVCGCIPRCPAARHVLIAFEADGKWPDGSRKGRFSCATAGIPSAAPPRGM